MQIASKSYDAGAPFKLNSLPQHAFGHTGWLRAERQALMAVANRGRLLLLGHPGTGKSLLLRSLEQTLTDQGLTVVRFRSGDLLDDLAGQDVLLVDEAANLSVVEVEQLGRLPNAIIMCGLPSLPEQLSLRPDAFHAVSLEPLSPEEVVCFVIARLLASGRSRDSFTPEALVAVARQSGGLFRLIVVLAGAAMFFAEQRGIERVTIDEVAEAVSMRSVRPEEPVGLDTKVLGQRPLSRTTKVRAAWLGPVAVRAWHWNRIAGTSAFVCASFLVIGAAVIAARQFDTGSSLALHDVLGRSMPKMAFATVPDLAVSPASELSLSAPVELEIALPPPQADTTSSPEDAMLSATGTGSSKTAETRSYNASAGTALPLLVQPPVSTGREQRSVTELAFSGPILNESMGQGGQLSLQLRIRGLRGSINAVFHASKGLIGSGMLTGKIDDEGHITLSGRLMMGRNPFECALQGTLRGERLTGAATFFRATNGVTARSIFTLSLV